MKILIILLHLLLYQQEQVQDSTKQSTPSSPDSTGVDATAQVMELVQQADSVALADSINKIVIERQLQSLRPNDRRARRQLDEELEQLRIQDSIRRVELEQNIALVKSTTQGYPVVVYGDTILTFFTSFRSLTAEERADIVTKRLEKVFDVYIPSQDSLSIESGGNAEDIYYKETLLLTVSQEDAIWLDTRREILSQELKQRLEEKIVEYRSSQSIIKYAKQAGLALLIIFMQVMIFKGVNYVFRAKVRPLIWSKRGVWFKGITIKSNEVVNETQQTSAILTLSKVVQYALIFVLIYLTLPLLFSIFPLTERFAKLLISYILNPVKSIVTSVIGYLPEFITVIVIVTITRYFLKILHYFSKEIANENMHLPGFYPDWARPTYNIIRVMVLAFMLVVIWPYLPGSDSAIFQGVSVFIGLVVSLGSTSVIGNLVAGMVITYMRPFKPGDQIGVNDIVGTVVEKSAFVTRVRTVNKEYITIPNSNILTTNVINYSASLEQGGLVITTTVTIGYDVPWRKVHHLLLAAAKRTELVNTEVEPTVFQTSLDDYYVSYRLNLHILEPSKKLQILSDLHQNVQDGFRDASIEIMSPHYRANRDGNEITIPAKPKETKD